ncbi:MBL fold hydrolase [Spirochaetia bacterium]|nr:MBL fold hydrolase [Spirochaetia bacterium]
MIVRFWGVRGSLPTPDTPTLMKSNLAAILDRVTPEDIKSPASKKKFLKALPPFLTNIVGGNTACLTVDGGPAGEQIIFDAGSGIREMGNAVIRKKEKISRYHLFISHFHWDHLQGFPFFIPAYIPSVTLDFYSPLEGLETSVRGQMCAPFFPVTLDTMQSKKVFHEMKKPVKLGNLHISFRKMSHPGDSYSYLVDDGKHRFLYATDTELSEADFIKNKENSSFFSGVDLAVIDAQYTLDEAITKYNWGHSSFSLAVDFASSWGMKHLILFHHDPAYGDEKLFKILDAARTYVEKMNIKGIKVDLAWEGLEIEL